MLIFLQHNVAKNFASVEEDEDEESTSDGCACKC